jgi:ABC-type transport system involved in cytochrome bd biosynthesis fused ATPase/permease subunit
METFYDYLAHYPVVQIVIAILFILLFLFLLKKFFKMALVTILVIFMTLMGYYFLTSSGKLDEKVKSALDKTKQQTERVMDKGKSLIKDEADKIAGDTGKLFEKQKQGATDRKKVIDSLEEKSRPEKK